MKSGKSEKAFARFQFSGFREEGEPSNLEEEDPERACSAEASKAGTLTATVCDPRSPIPDPLLPLKGGTTNGELSLISDLQSPIPHGRNTFDDEVPRRPRPIFHQTGICRNSVTTERATSMQMADRTFM